jgi:hypothetical protein
MKRRCACGKQTLERDAGWHWECTRRGSIIHSRESCRCDDDTWGLKCGQLIVDEVVEPPNGPKVRRAP